MRTLSASQLRSGSAQEPRIERNLERFTFERDFNHIAAFADFGTRGLQPELVVFKTQNDITARIRKHERNRFDLAEEHRSRNFDRAAERSRNHLAVVRIVAFDQLRRKFEVIADETALLGRRSGWSSDRRRPAGGASPAPLSAE